MVKYLLTNPLHKEWIESTQLRESGCGTGERLKGCILVTCILLIVNGYGRLVKKSFQTKADLELVYTEDCTYVSKNLLVNKAISMLATKQIFLRCSVGSGS